MKGLLAGMLLLLLGGAPAVARVGDPVDTFNTGPLIHQLRLTPQNRFPLAGPMASSVLHRFVSDDGAITVDLVVRGGVIEQQLMYVGLDIRWGYQVGFFLQDALGSVVGAQKGMIAYRAAVINRSETFMPFTPYTMRFTPIEANRLRVLVSR